MVARSLRERAISRVACGSDAPEALDPGPGPGTGTRRRSRLPKLRQGGTVRLIP